jgi:hypothetical protein
MIAPKQSATQLRRNLMQAKLSQEQHKHMDPAQLRLIQLRVQTARQELTKQKLDTLTVPVNSPGRNPGRAHWVV